MTRLHFWFVWIPAAISLLVRCCHTECSEVSNFTCDHTGNALLDTSSFYEQCKETWSWSIRDKNNTNLRLVNPSQNVTVKCDQYIYLKLQCVVPKINRVVCYNQIVTDERSLSSPHHNSSVAEHATPAQDGYYTFLIIPVILLGLICWRFKKHRDQKRRKEEETRNEEHKMPLRQQGEKV